MSLRLSNRRKRPDLILRLLAWSNGIAVASLFIAVCLVALAKPKRMNFLDHFYGVQRLSPAWDKSMIGYIGGMLLLSFSASIVGIFLNSKRLRRKKDHIHATLVLSLIASAVSMFFYLKFTLG
ncbi:hypothetical protein [uncultured Desulfuromusa sp.]|uniref:hypothetical protein n=1 Tax=uncultured Desulfuromusa sp. TaxID=219183 RepID=UPI002AA5FD4A|nr:hypothetical protein [uncultured Desulfuromusa sp.]